MAQPFTDAQRDAIRQRLFDSACRHARETGVKKTSLDALTADAGISKSSFYKFYESKEQLFLAVASAWEQEILAHGISALECSQEQTNKARAAASVFAMFETIHRMGLTRFLREDLPYLNAFLPRDMAREHCLTSARGIFDALRQARIRFTEPDDTVLAVIQLMYLSILSIGDIGENFFPALHMLVSSACDKLVA